jgi:hypothetical protein
VTADQFLVLACRHVVGREATGPLVGEPSRPASGREGGCGGSSEASGFGCEKSARVNGEVSGLADPASASSLSLLTPPAVVREVRAGVWKATA